MQRITILTVLLVFIHVISFAQEDEKKSDTAAIVEVTGESDPIRWYQDRETKNEVKEKALQEAKVNALERAFGSVVIEGNSTYVKNVQTNEQAETQSVFQSIGDSYVKGEILQVQEKNFEDMEEEVTVNGEKKTRHFIKCRIKVTARELTSATVKFEAFPLSGNTKNNKTTHFYQNDDIFFYFKSPVSGYLSIFVDITGSGTTQRILPYQQVPREFESGMPVKADKEYIFFSPENNYYPDKSVFTDEIYAAPEKQHEMWRFFVIFSQEPVKKPMLEADNSKLTEAEKEEGYKMPKMLDSEEFQRWKINQQQLNPDMQVKVIDVSVEKD